MRERIGATLLRRLRGLPVAYHTPHAHGVLLVVHDGERADVAGAPPSPTAAALLSHVRASP